MATQDSRIRIKRATTGGDVPTVPASTDHTDGTWTAFDVYVGELFMNTQDSTLWARTDNGVRCFYGHARLELTSAQVKALYTTPQQFNLTVPTGFIPNIIGDIWLMSTYGTAAYATNTSLRIRSVGGSQNYVSAVNVLAFSADVLIPLTKNAVTSGKGFETGADLEVYVPVGNPTAGDSDVVIFFDYVLTDTTS